MKKLALILLITIALLLLSLPVTCKVANHDRVIWFNGQLYCELVEVLPDNTKMTVRTRLIDIISAPQFFNHWWIQFNEGKYPSV